MNYTSDYAKSFEFRSSEPIPRFIGFWPKLSAPNSFASHTSRLRSPQLLYLPHFRKSAGGLPRRYCNSPQLREAQDHRFATCVFPEIYKSLFPQLLSFVIYTKRRGVPARQFFWRVVSALFWRRPGVAPSTLPFWNALFTRSVSRHSSLATFIDFTAGRSRLEEVHPQSHAQSWRM